MTRPLAAIFASAIVLSACGKKEPAAASGNQNPPPVRTSLDALVSAPETAPPPPPGAAAPESNPSAAAPEPTPVEGNWFSKKTTAEKQEIMEGWLYNYHNNDAATKAAIMKQVQETKLSAADKALLQSLGARLKYPPMPVK